METVIRVTIIYVALMLGFRVIGKRELSQLSSFELVTLMMIPEMVSNALSFDDHSLTQGLLGAATIFALVFFTSVLSYFWKPAARVIEGGPTVLVDHGRYRTGALNRERVSESEVQSELHKVGLERVEQVRWAILEADGKISVIPETGAYPVPHPRSPSDELSVQ